MFAVDFGLVGFSCKVVLCLFCCSFVVGVFKVAGFGIGGVGWAPICLGWLGLCFGVRRVCVLGGLSVLY